MAHNVTRGPQGYRVQWVLQCRARIVPGHGVFVVLGCPLAAGTPPFFSLRPSPLATHGQLPLGKPCGSSYYLDRGMKREGAYCGGRHFKEAFGEF